jgi:hypothetical protein
MSDEELISAYVDGHMSEPERAAFEARVQADAALRRQVAVTRLLVDQSRQVESVPAPKNFILPHDFGKAAPQPVPAPRFNLRQLFFRLGSVAAAVVFMFAVAFDTLRTTLPAAPIPAAAPMAAQAPEAGITSNTEPVTATAPAAQAADAAGAMMAEATPMAEARSMMTNTITDTMTETQPSAMQAAEAPAEPSTKQMPAPEAQMPAMETPAPQPQPESLFSPLRIIAGVALLIAIASGIIGWLRK